MKGRIIPFVVLAVLSVGVSVPVGHCQENPLRFAGARVQGDMFVMEVVGAGSGSCVLEAADALGTAWAEVEPGSPVGEDPIEVAIDRDQRFFRIRCGELFSVNAAGYAGIELTRYALVTNPFQTDGDTLLEVLGADSFSYAVEHGFEASRQAWHASEFVAGTWLDSGRRLVSGEGVLLVHLGHLGGPPDAVLPMTLGGLVEPGAGLPAVEGGWNLVGLPAWASASSSLHEIFNPQEGDRIALLDGGQKTYEIYDYETAAWFPNEPFIRLGEGFWYSRNAPSATRPGGSVLFSNAESVGAPQLFYDLVGCPMEGDEWAAGLHAVPDAGSLAPVGNPVPFLTGAGAGYFDTGADAVRHISTVPPGSEAYVAVAVWRPQDGATFEEARARGGLHGMTKTILIPAGGFGDPPSLPTLLFGLEALNPGELLPLIREISGENIVFPGAPARLSVSLHYSGPRAVSYQWQRQSSEGEWVDLDGATGAILEFAPVTSTDAGGYRVVVDAGCAAGTSDPIELTVLAAPPFSNLSLDPGNGAFRFTFEADPAYSYAIQVSTDLVTWVLLSTVSNPSGPVKVTDPDAPGHLHRFYRARVLTDGMGSESLPGSHLHF